MGFLCLAVPSMFVLSPPALAQETPKVEVFGGYSYLNADTNNLASPSRQSANGWEASVSGNFNKWFAVEGSVSGYYKTYSVDVSALGLGLNTIDLNVHDYSFVGGPRLNFRPVFFHALVGADHLTGSVLGFSRSQNSFAGAFGGGVEWKVAPHWAVRGSADYVLTRHNILNLIPGVSEPDMTQNNFRASVGIVFMFGRGGEFSENGRGSASKADHTHGNAGATQTSGPCESISVAPILGISGCATGDGLRVTSVRMGSLASQAGINVGDLVAKIDGRPVQSGRDIELAIAANKTGTIIVSYMIKNAWLAEREVKVR